jgi:hypothetical protein
MGVLEKERTMSKRCCSNCANAVRLASRWFRVFLAHAPGLLACINHPDGAGQIMAVSCAGACANFRPRHKTAVRSAPLEPPDDNVRYIPLTQGKYAIVDAGDYEWLSQYKWHAVRDCRTGTYYARRYEKGRRVAMHSQIMQPPKGKVTDHMNGNGLDNRRGSLRNCSRLENSRNRRKNRTKAAGFKGVWQDKKTGKYRARIRFQHKTIYLGTHTTAVEAARAYDHKAIELFGQFARLNFPEEHPAQTSPSQ